MGIKERSQERRGRIVSHIAHGHEEAEQWDLEYWQSRTPQERLSAFAAIREDVEKAQAGRAANPRRGHA